MLFENDHLRAELELRLQVLPAETRRWGELAAVNDNGFGIHRSQIQAIQGMFEELEVRQRNLWAILMDSPEAEFANARAKLEREMCGSHGLMAIFRLMFTQRDDLYYRPLLDAADLVAADCYGRFLEKARTWGAIEEARFREPPLTYLNAVYSPAAFTRRHAFGAFKMPLEGYPELKLPISVLSLPFSHTPTFWALCSLYHEVGHAIDQDLQLTEALWPSVEAWAISDGRGGGIWRLWLREIVADAIGVLLGGAAFGRTMLRILRIPKGEVLDITSQDTHPNPYVRVFIIGTLLRNSAWPESKRAADELEQDWQALYPAGQDVAELSALTEQAKSVAALVLNTPLDALGGHVLGELSEDGSSQALIERLTLFLRGEGRRPDPDNPNFSIRLVPAAAQAAFQGVASDFAAQGQLIHRKALEYTQAMRRPRFLSGDQHSRSEYLRQLARHINFDAMDVDF